MASQYPSGYAQPAAYNQQPAAQQQSYAQQAPAQYAGGAQAYSGQQAPPATPPPPTYTSPAAPGAYSSQPISSPTSGYSQPAAGGYGQAGYGAAAGYGHGGYAAYGQQPTGPYTGAQPTSPYTGYGQQQATNPQYNRNAVVPNPNVHNPTGQLWSTSLFGCFEDMFVCCVGYYMTGPMYGENYRKVYNDGFCVNCILYSCCYCFSCCFANRTRAALRQKYNLPEEPCGDCCVHCFCSPCAVCQEARELRHRGGWKTWH